MEFFDDSVSCELDFTSIYALSTLIDTVDYLFTNAFYPLLISDNQSLLVLESKKAATTELLYSHISTITDSMLNSKFLIISILPQKKLINLSHKHPVVQKKLRNIILSTKLSRRASNVGLQPTVSEVCVPLTPLFSSFYLYVPHIKFFSNFIISFFQTCKSVLSFFSKLNKFFCDPLPQIEILRFWYMVSHEIKSSCQSLIMENSYNLKDKLALKM